MNMPSYLPHGPYIRSCLAVTFGGDSVAHLGSATTLCHLPWYCRWFDPTLALTVFIPHNTVSIPKPCFVSSTELCNHALLISYASSKSTAEYPFTTNQYRYHLLKLHLASPSWGSLSSAASKRLQPGAGFPNTVGGSIPPGHLGFLSLCNTVLS